jgi:hypothetical protein
VSTTSRICSDIRRTARGVNAADTSRRIRACSSWPSANIPWSSPQRSIVPSVGETCRSQMRLSSVAFSGSLNSRFTSSWRVTSQKPSDAT